MRKLFFFIFTLLFVVALRNPTPVFAQTCECKLVTHYNVGDFYCEVDPAKDKCIPGTTARCNGTISTCASAGCSCLSPNDPTPTPITGCLDDRIALFSTTCKNLGYTIMCPGYGVGGVPAKCCAPGKCPPPLSNVPPKNSPCDTLTSEQQRSSCQKCMVDNNKVWTAIGCIEATSTGLINTFLPFGIGIAGGIAFLLILFGALQMMMSAGNPEKLNAGKELVTAAITGLLLIIFSIFLLQLIGVRILKIPGFE